jgi:hypothetical protein
LNVNQPWFAFLISEFKVVERILFASQVGIHGGQIQLRNIPFASIFVKPTQLPLMHSREATSREGFVHRKSAFLVSRELKHRLLLLGCLFLHPTMHVGAAQHVRQLRVVWLGRDPQASLVYCRSM